MKQPHSVYTQTWCVYVPAGPRYATFDKLGSPDIEVAAPVSVIFRLTESLDNTSAYTFYFTFGTRGELTSI